MNTAFSSRLASRFQMVSRVLGRAMPWLSMAWGIASGILISRSFEMASRVLAFAAALFVASLILGLWSLWIERQLPQALSQRTLRTLAVTHRMRIDWVVVTSTQFFAQYLLMFALPFLYYARAWPYLGIAVLLVCSTLWDPLFFVLVRHYAYGLFLKACAFGFAASFLACALLPRLAHHYGIIALAAALLGAFPWRYVHASPRGAKEFVASALPIFLVFGAVAAHQNWGWVARFPPLAIWVKGGSFVLQDSEGAWGNAVGRDTGDLASALVARTLFEGGRLCCVSPVVAPRALQRQVVHEWWIGGRRIDVIELPALQGRDNGSAYKTYSCKKNMPAVADDPDAEVECRVFVGTDSRERIQVGVVRVEAR